MHFLAKGKSVVFSLLFSRCNVLVCLSVLNLTLSKRTNFRLFQTQSVCRRQFNLDGNGGKFSKQVENTVGIGEIAPYKQFLLFPVFSKDLKCRHIKTRACLGKG